MDLNYFIPIFAAIISAIRLSGHIPQLLYLLFQYRFVFFRRFGGVSFSAGVQSAGEICAQTTMEKHILLHTACINRANIFPCKLQPKGFPLYSGASFALFRVIFTICAHNPATTYYFFHIPASPQQLLFFYSTTTV